MVMRKVLVILETNINILPLLLCMKKNIPESTLRDLYIIKGLSLSDISIRLKVAVVTVHRNMVSYNIPRRKGYNGVWNEERKEIVRKKMKLKMLGNSNPKKEEIYEYKAKASAINRAKEIRGDVCQICDWKESSCDGHHIISIIKGGKHTVSNIVILCPNHHRLWHKRKVGVSDINGHQ